MEADKKPEEKTASTTAPSGSGDNKPAADALAKPDDGTIDATTGGSLNSVGGDKGTGSDGKPAKKPSALKKFFKRFNVYFLFFVLLIVIGGIFTTISYLNSRKVAPIPSVSSQSLNQSELKKLANSNATVGDSGETLTVQGNAVFSGNVLVRSDLDVAGTIESGGPLDVAQLTVSNSAILASTQISSLQVQNTALFSGLVTVQNGMNVAGNSSFTGNVSISNLTITNLTLASNAQLTVPNHIVFTGATPGRTIDFDVLGNGGSASIFGSDTSGTITINTGNNPLAGCFIDVRFNVPFSQTPNIVIFPINAAGGGTQYYAEGSPTDFHICTANAAAANQAFGYSYFITS